MHRFWSRLVSQSLSISCSEGAVRETTPHCYGRLEYLVNLTLCSQVKVL
jgi:hypothetical protein